MRNKVVLGGVLLVAAFLLGLIPQYMKARRLDADLTACRLGARLATVRDLAARTYLEASRRNYGLAADHAGRFFNEVQDVAGQTTEPALRQRLEELLQARDEVTAGLAKADPGVLRTLEDLLLKAQAAGSLAETKE